MTTFPSSSPISSFISCVCDLPVHTIDLLVHSDSEEDDIDDAIPQSRSTARRSSRHAWLIPSNYPNHNIAQYFRGLFTHLASAAIQQLKLPTPVSLFPSELAAPYLAQMGSSLKNIDAEEGSDDPDELRDIRNNAFDIFYDCSRITGVSVLLNHLVQWIGMHFPNLANGASWAEVEAGIAATNCLNRAFLREFWELRRSNPPMRQQSSDPHGASASAYTEAQVVIAFGTPIATIVQCLPHLPSNIPILMAACMDMIASYAQWLRTNPALLQALFPVIRFCLGTPIVASAAARTTGNLFLHCSEICTPILLETVQILPQLTHMSIRAREDILSGVGAALSTEAGQSLFVPVAQALFAPLFEVLQRELSAITLPQVNAGETQRAAARRHYASMLLAFDQMAVFLKSIDVADPALQAQLVTSVWPVVQTFLSNPIASSQELIMERAIRVAKYLLKQGPSAFHPHAVLFLTLVFQNYTNRPYSCFIYACNQIISVYRSDQAMYPTFAEAVRHFTDATIRLLQEANTTGRDTATSIPEIVEDFFNLISRATTDIHYTIALQLPHFADLLMMGANALRLHQVEALLSVLVCLENILSIGLPDENGAVRTAELDHIRHALMTNNCGQIFAQNLMMSLGGHAPSTVEPELIATVRALVDIAGQQFAVWLHHAFSQYPTYAQQHLASRNILDRICSARGRDFMDAIRDFQNICDKYKLF